MHLLSSSLRSAPPQLCEVNFTRVPPNQTMSMAVKLHNLPKKPATKDFRAMEEDDVESAWKLLMNYLPR